MKKLLIGLLLVGSCLLAKEPVSWGVLKGDIKSYYPQLTITDSYLISNTATTGVTANKPQALSDTQSSFMKDFQKSAKKSCKNSYGYALDHFQVSSAIQKYANMQCKSAPLRNTI